MVFGIGESPSIMYQESIWSLKHRWFGMKRGLNDSEAPIRPWLGRDNQRCGTPNNPPALGSEEVGRASPLMRLGNKEASIDVIPTTGPSSSCCEWPLGSSLCGSYYL